MNKSPSKHLQTLYPADDIGYDRETETNRPLHEFVSEWQLSIHQCMAVGIENRQLVEVGEDFVSCDRALPDGKSCRFIGTSLCSIVDEGYHEVKPGEKIPYPNSLIPNSTL